MKCLETYLNGEKLCVAGVGEYGVLSAHVTWVADSPEKLARWAAEGREDFHRRDVQRVGKGEPVTHRSVAMPVVIHRGEQIPMVQSLRHKQKRMSPDNRLLL